jgi:hypothetical protein
MLLTIEECLLVKPLGGHGTNVVGTIRKNLVFAKKLVLLNPRCLCFVK